MRFVHPPSPVPSIAVAESDARFPVRRVICVGRNYAAHAREMGKDPDREPPFFFLKPADAVVDASAPFGVGVPYPPLTRDLHHEIELVAAIGSEGTDIAEADALRHVYGYAVGVDLTRRDLQLAARDAGRPWDWGKGFDHSAPIGALRALTGAQGHPASGRIWLTVNGAVRQNADLAELIWSVPEIIAHASRAMTLKPGDLIMTGTPAGVGALQTGDVVEGGVEGVGQVRFHVAERERAAA